jgi:hypothetical protein
LSAGDCGPYFREVRELIRAVKNKVIWRKYHGNEKVGEAGQERREGKRQEDQGRKEHVDDVVQIGPEVLVARDHQEKVARRERDERSKSASLSPGEI